MSVAEIVNSTIITLYTRKESAFVENERHVDFDLTAMIYSDENFFFIFVSFVEIYILRHAQPTNSIVGKSASVSSPNISAFRSLYGRRWRNHASIARQFAASLIYLTK